MINKTIVLLLFIMQLFPSCRNINKSEKEDVGFLSNGVLDLDSTSKSKFPKLIYVFNGNCSLCLLKLKELQDEIESGNMDNYVEPIFIATQADPDILSYNIEKINFKYPVVFDSLNLLQNRNPKLYIENDFFYLIDSSNIVLSKSKSFSELY